MKDKIENLPNPPFEFKITKQNKTLIYRGSKLVKTLSPNKTAAFQSKLVGKSNFEVQMILAKVTGAYKFGNEKANREKD